MDSPNLPVKWTEMGYVEKSQYSEIQLASGGNVGSISSPLIEVGDSVQILVRAKQAGTDKGAPLTVSCNDVVVGTFPTTVDYQTFKLKIASTAFSSVTFKFSAGVGKRVIVDLVDIYSYENVDSRLFLEGYPQVETALTHQVVNLQKNATYYYTVQPQGGLNTTIYGPIKVVTSTTALSNLPISKVKWSITSNRLLLENLELKSTVYLLDTAGRVWYSISKTASDVLEIPLLGYGVFILRVNNDAPIKIVKNR